jgi:hypothetical protein
MSKGQKRILTDKEYNVFSKLCSLRQPAVLDLVNKLLQKQGYQTIYKTSKYVIGIGDIPVGLVAHADTVFTRPPEDFFYDTKRNVIWSPDGLGADDRAGVFAIIKVLNTQYRPHIIITTDEEKGCSGAMDLTEIMPQFPAPLNFLIQIDRRGGQQSVYYDCANEEFELFINSFGFNTFLGSFSDISVLAPRWGVSAVNLSAGYRDEHSVSEHLYVDDLMYTIDKIISILATVQQSEEKIFYPYIEKPFYYPTNSYALNGWGCDWCNDLATPEELMPIKVNSQVVNICNTCYSKVYKHIEWCCVCGEAHLLTDDNERKLVEESGYFTWICPTCRQGGKTNDTSKRSAETAV